MVIKVSTAINVTVGAGQTVTMRDEGGAVLGCIKRIGPAVLQVTHPSGRLRFMLSECAEPRFMRSSAKCISLTPETP